MNECRIELFDEFKSFRTMPENCFDLLLSVIYSLDV